MKISFVTSDFPNGFTDEFMKEFRKFNFTAISG